MTGRLTGSLPKVRCATAPEEPRASGEMEDGERDDRLRRRDQPMNVKTALHTDLCDRLGITYPIFGFNHSIDVTVEVCKAGGIGIYGATRRTPEEIRAEL